MPELYGGLSIGIPIGSPAPDGTLGPSCPIHRQVTCAGNVIAIYPVVLDEFGNPLAATVKVSGAAEWTAVGSNPQFTGLPPGRYLINVSASGYKSQDLLSPRIPDDISSCSYTTLFSMVPN